MPMRSWCQVSLACVMVHRKIVPRNNGYSRLSIGSASGATVLDLVMPYVMESWLPVMLFKMYEKLLQF